MPVNSASEPVEDELFRITYASTQTSKMSSSELIDVLNCARKRNQELNITGVLLHREDSFLQVIEGEKSAVVALFDRIKQDSRHQRIEVLINAPIQEREFSDWQMGFLELDDVDVTLLPGFSNFLNEADDSRTVLKRLSQTQRLMLLFKGLG